MTEQMLILTPEKWDVVTRKAGDTALANLVRLLIIDEVSYIIDFFHKGSFMCRGRKRAREFPLKCSWPTRFSFQL